MQTPVSNMYEVGDRVFVVEHPDIVGTVVDVTEVLVEVKRDTGGHCVYYHEHVEYYTRPLAEKAA